MTLYAESNSAKIIPKEDMRQSELSMWRISYDIMVFCILVRASWHDLQHKRIPDRCCIWLSGIGLVRIFVCPECTWSICRGLLGAAAGSVPMFLTTLVAPGAFGGYKADGSCRTWTWTERQSDRIIDRSNCSRMLWGGGRSFAASEAERSNCLWTIS